MPLLDELQSLWHWLRGLPPDFAFLLSLPVVVALAGLMASLGDGTNRSRRDERL